jgi:hypothetical protein
VPGGPEDFASAFRVSAGIALVGLLITLAFIRAYVDTGRKPTAAEEAA